DDGSLLRVEIAREDLHERGLATPVRPRQAVPPAGLENARHVLKDNLRAVAHRDVRNGNHRAVLRGSSMVAEPPILPDWPVTTATRTFTLSRGPIGRGAAL